MADVFISYAHSTAKQAQAAAAALRALGYSVWLDDDLASHRAFTHAIEEQLTAAKAALVLWSADAARSQWVLSEANRAREGDKLVQLVLDNTRLPMPFDQVQCADLGGWSGKGEHPNWRRVIACIADLVGAEERQTAVTKPAPPESAPLLAVLPFDNLSGDPELLYFSDGLSEEILQTVARTTKLRVIGRSSSFQFRGVEKSARRVSAELNCSHILDGSVRRGGSRLRVAASLIECAGQTMLWSDRFDRDLADVFALQDEIAAAVADALNHTFSPASDIAQIDPAAYDLYLRARARRAEVEAAAVGADAADWMSASDIGLLEQAVARAPKFAQAWAEMALAKAVLASSQASPEGFAALSDESRRAAQAALSIDEDAGAAYAAQSLLLPICGKFQEREQLLARGRTATQSDEFVFYQSSVFSSRVGRLRDALDFVSQAYQLNPLVPNIVFWRAYTLFHVGSEGEAFELWDQGRARWPDHGGMHLVPIFYAAVAGEWEQVDLLWAGAERAARRPDGNPTNLEGVSLLRNRPANARDLLVNLGRDEIARTGTLGFTFMGFMALAGFVDAAYELIEAASFEQLFIAGPSAAVSSGMNPLFDAQNSPLRNDRRFVSFCTRLGLCDYWVSTDRWPDCADQVPYDFRAEARRFVRPTPDRRMP